MKRFLATIFMICSLIAVANAERTYKVFSVSGEVVKESDSQQLKRNDILNGSDRIFIKTGSGLSLCDTENKRIYKSMGKEGRTSIAKIILSARQASREVSTLLGGGKKNNNVVSKVGAAYRGSSCDSLAASISESLRNTIPSQLITSDILGEREYADDGSFTFSITNNSDRITYANILSFSKTGISVCISLGTEAQCLVLQPGEKLHIEGLEFFEEDTDNSNAVQYRVLALPQPFDSQELEFYLKRDALSSFTENPQLKVSLSNIF